MRISKAELFFWCESRAEEQLALLKELAAIPAPSHHEEKRAEFIFRWLKDRGAKQVRTDSAMNVVLPLGDWAENKVLVCMAHTDVVFPDTDPLPVRQEGNRLYAPGAGDDTANVVALMLCAEFFLTHPEFVPEPMLFVFNSCEEGLGNLKGVRQIMADYAENIRALVSFDCQSDSIISQAVGSHRWKIDVSTKGGHSFSDFGVPNAIACVSRLVTALYCQEVPRKSGTRTTYNVGTVEGGTSVNTIAQNASITYEYRSNEAGCLAHMEAQFHRILDETDIPGAYFSVNPLGIRPCGEKVPEETHNMLLNRCAMAIREIYGIDPPLCAASTDANIPLSMGIPAATFGLYRGGGAHTRQEFVLIDSLTPGLKTAMLFLLSGNIK